MKQIYAYNYVLGFLFLMLSPFLLHAQSGSIAITSGPRQIHFVVNSFDKFKNGVKYEDLQTIRVTYAVGVPGDRWKLYVKAQDPNFEGAGGGTLSLDNMMVNAECTTCDGLTVHNNTDELTDGDVAYISNADDGIHTVLMSYYFGVWDPAEYKGGNSTEAPDPWLMNVVPDYYTTTIEIILLTD